MTVKLNYKQIIADALQRFSDIVKECTEGQDYNTIIGLTCASLYGGEDCMPVETDKPIDEVKPVLDTDFCFEYKGYHFELSSCNILSHKKDLLGLTEENFNQRFPHGVFSDRYVCWMTGHKDIEGYTKEESSDPKNWCPMIYLVNDTWSWGADFDLKPGNAVQQSILSAIDKFLETFKE